MFGLWHITATYQSPPNLFPLCWALTVTANGKSGVRKTCSMQSTGWWRQRHASSPTSLSTCGHTHTHSERTSSCCTQLWNVPLWLHTIILNPLKAKPEKGHPVYKEMPHTWYVSLYCTLNTSMYCRDKHLCVSPLWNWTHLHWQYEVGNDSSHKRKSVSLKIEIIQA